jgi:hypothetical protein
MQNETPVGTVGLSRGIIDRVTSYVTQEYGRQLSFLYAGKPVNELLGSLTEDQITDLATGDLPLSALVKMLGTPETKSVHWQIYHRNPHISEMYPDIDIYALQQNQLERLASGDTPQEVLGKPTGDISPLLIVRQNPMDPPKNKTSNRGGKGSPRNAYKSSNGTRKAGRLGDY